MIGEPIRVFTNQGDHFVDDTEALQLAQTRGWWNTIEVDDFDQDGDMDIIAGNHGSNSFFKPKTRMYLHDFDRNGTTEHLICHELNGRYYPIADRDELIAQMPSLKKKILYYKDYASMAMSDLFTSEVIDQAEKFEVDMLESSILINGASGFTIQTLPQEAQYSSVFAIEPMDVNSDGWTDLVLGGNQYLVKPQFGRQDALNGLILFGSKEGYSSGNIEFLDIEGQIRDIKKLKYKGDQFILFAINNQSIEVYETTN